MIWLSEQNNFFNLITSIYIWFVFEFYKHQPALNKLLNNYLWFSSLSIDNNDLIRVTCPYKKSSKPFECEF